VKVVALDVGTVMRTTFEPGWRWSECVKPVVGGDSCQADHFGYSLQIDVFCALARHVAFAAIRHVLPGSVPEVSPRISSADSCTILMQS
jgi:hypothetical protein